MDALAASNPRACSVLIRFLANCRHGNNPASPYWEYITVFPHLSQVFPYPGDLKSDYPCGKGGDAVRNLFIYRDLLVK